MKKQTDRVKQWRERQKAEGRTSITVLLSPEVRAVLASEKERTGEAYSVIVEKALMSFNKQGKKTSGLKYAGRSQTPATLPATRKDPLPVIQAADQEKRREPKRLIDDLANYPSIKDIELEQTLKKENSLYDFQMKKGIFKRLFGSSAGSSLGRRNKKWFQ